MYSKLLAYWNSLPTSTKTIIVIFAGAATGVLRHALQNPDACMTEACWKGYIFSALHAGGLAVGAYLMQSPLSRDIVAAPGQK
jgi:hypothetical protein